MQWTEFAQQVTSMEERIKLLEAYITNLEHPIEIKVKPLHKDAKLPTKDKDNIGWDIACIRDNTFSYEYQDVGPPTGFKFLAAGTSHIFSTGIAMQIPPGYAMLLWDRSGMGAKKNIHRLAGVIDSNYRGEIQVCLINLNHMGHKIYEGDRIIQGVIHREITARMIEADQLDETSRGTKGFGSSGA